MPLREILQKKDDIHYTTNGQYATGMSAPMSPPGPAVPEIRFVASDTTTSDEIITSPVIFDEDDYDRRLDPSRPSSASSSPRKSMNFLRRSSRSPSNEFSTEGATLASPTSPTGRPRRLSQLLHLDRSGSRSPSPVSAHIPADLPHVDDGLGDAQDREAQWEKRATVLVQNPNFGGGLSPSSSFHGDQSGSSFGSGTRSRSSSRGAVDSTGDVCAAIRMFDCLVVNGCRLIFKRRFVFTNLEVRHIIYIYTQQILTCYHRTRSLYQNVRPISRPERRQPRPKPSSLWPRLTVPPIPLPSPIHPY